MKIAIHNPHLGPNIYNLGIHNYIFNLIKDGHVAYIYIDKTNKDFNKEIVRWGLYLLKLERFFSHKPYRKDIMEWDFSKIIYTQKELNSKCDVLISFNTHLRDMGVSKAVKKFDGLKVWHVGDYFWNEPASQINKRFLNYGISHIMGYAAHDKYCNYFKKSFPTYEGKVIPVPFGYADRFKNEINFEHRINKVIGVGSVNPLKPLDYPIYNYRESSDFYPDESWFHKTRRKLIINKKTLNNHMDFLFPEFPKIKDFRYNLVEKFNEYKMFTSCESIWYFPPAKTFEGSACGTVNVCIDHDCNKDFGFRDGINCIMYKEGDLNDFREKIDFYMRNDSLLNEISNNAINHVSKNHKHEMIAKHIVDSIKRVK